MSHEGGNAIPEIEREEHQHNLRAKRVVLLNDSGEQMFLPLKPIVDFDLLTATNTGATTENVILSKDGTPVLTLAMTYTGAGVAKVSDDIASIGFS